MGVLVLSINLFEYISPQEDFRKLL